MITCSKSSLVWAWLDVPSHNQPKAVVSLLLFIIVHWTTNNTFHYSTLDSTWQIILLTYWYYYVNIFSCRKISESKLTAHKLSSGKITSTLSGGNFEKNVLEQDCVYHVFHNTWFGSKKKKKAKVSYECVISNETFILHFQLIVSEIYALFCLNL